MQDVIKIITVVIGTVIGAGFISGQEIYSFFNKYGSARKDRNNSRNRLNINNNI